MPSVRKPNLDESRDRHIGIVPTQIFHGTYSQLYFIMRFHILGCIDFHLFLFVSLFSHPAPVSACNISSSCGRSACPSSGEAEELVPPHSPDRRLLFQPTNWSTSSHNFVATPQEDWFKLRNRIREALVIKVFNYALATSYETAPTDHRCRFTLQNFNSILQCIYIIYTG